MGSWQLEVGKFFFYVMFPVAAFHVFNLPDIFDRWVGEEKERVHLERQKKAENFKALKKEYLKKLKQKEAEAELVA